MRIGIGIGIGIRGNRLGGHLGGSPVMHVHTSPRGDPVEPGMIVIHYAAGLSGTPLASLGNARRPVAAHLSIHRDGTVTQYLPFDRPAPCSASCKQASAKTPHGHSIDIEIENHLPPMKPFAGQWLIDAYRQPSPGHGDRDELAWRSPGAGLPRTRWQGYTPWQSETCRELAALLVATYGIDEIRGHDELPTQGPLHAESAFPLAWLRAAVLPKSDSSRDLGSCGLRSADRGR